MDISSSYAGVRLVSPIVVGASPLALDIDRVRDLAAHGAGAIVLPSIFEEQITEARFVLPRPSAQPWADTATQDSISTHIADLDAYNGGTTRYLHSIEATKAVISIPLIASISCATTGEWMDYAKQIQDAGADAIELNVYHYAVDPHQFADDIERDLVERVSQFCSRSGLPISVKLLPQFTSLANVVFRMAGAGAKSVCLFGQFPAFETERSGRIGSQWRLTTKVDFRTCAAGISQVRAAAHNLTLAANGGIHNATDALTAMQLGADVVVLTSAIYRQGSEIITKIRDELIATMEQHRLISLDEFIGSQHGGYDPFPELTRRQEYLSAIAAFPSNSGQRRDS